MPRGLEDLAQSIATKEPLRRIRPSPSRPIWRLAVVTDQQEIQDAKFPNLYPSVVLWDGSYKWDGSVVWSNEPTLLNACDLLANWTGTALSLDTGDKVEGVASIKDMVAAPTPGWSYSTRYQPGIKNLTPYHWLTLYLKSDRGWADYKQAIPPCLVLQDTSARVRMWWLKFEPNRWTFFPKLLRLWDYDNGLDLSAVNYFGIRFDAEDAVAFWKKIDWLQVF